MRVVLTEATEMADTDAFARVSEIVEERVASMLANARANTLTYPSGKHDVLLLFEDVARSRNGQPSSGVALTAYLDAEDRPYSARISHNRLCARWPRLGAVGNDEEGGFYYWFDSLEGDMAEIVSVLIAATRLTAGEVRAIKGCREDAATRAAVWYLCRRVAPRMLSTLLPKALARHPEARACYRDAVAYGQRHAMAARVQARWRASAPYKAWRAAKLRAAIPRIVAVLLEASARV